LPWRRRFVLTPSAAFFAQRKEAKMNRQASWLTNLALVAFGAATAFVLAFFMVLGQ
jgi:hypothetical protein